MRDAWQRIVMTLHKLYAGNGYTPVAQRTGQLDEPWIQRAAHAAITAVAAHHSTWRPAVVRAEIERHARYGGVPLSELDDVVEAELAIALSDEVSIRLGPTDVLDEPAGLRRLDGSSVFSVAGSQLYTSTAILEANRES